METVAREFDITGLGGGSGATGFEPLLADAVRRGYVAAVRLLGEREAARDACQEAASRALAARSSYDPAREFYPWFYAILRNHCRDLVSRRGRLLFDERVAGAAAPGSLEQSYIEIEEERLVLDAVAALDPESREIIELRHFQDLSYRAIAELLGCAEGTVMSRLYRARRKLRDLVVAAERTPRERSR